MEPRTSLPKKIGAAPFSDWKWIIPKIFGAAISKAKKHDILSDSRALSYTFLLSLIPLLVIAFTVFQFFGGLTIFLENTLKPIVSKNFPESVASQLNLFIDSLFLNMSTGTIGAVSFATLVATVIALFMSIESSFNEIMESKTQRPLHRRIGGYWVLLTATPLVVVLSAVKSSELMDLIKPAIGKFLETGMLLESIRFFVGHGIQVVGFSALYSILPEKKLPLRAAFWAALITHLLFQILASINVHVTSFIYSNRTNLQIYGSIPLLLLVFLIWVRLIWLAILFGACICSVIERKINIHRNLNQLEPWQSPSETILNCVKVLESHINSFRQLSKPQTADDLFHHLNIPKAEVTLHHDRLVKLGFLLTMHFENQECFLPTMKALNCHENPSQLLSDLLALRVPESQYAFEQDEASQLAEEIRKILMRISHKQQ